MSRGRTPTHSAHPVACRTLRRMLSHLRRPLCLSHRRVAVAPPYKGATSATVRRQGSTAILRKKVLGGDEPTDVRSSCKSGRRADIPDQQLCARSRLRVGCLRCSTLRLGQDPRNSEKPLSALLTAGRVKRRLVSPMNGQRNENASHRAKMAIR